MTTFSSRAGCWHHSFWLRIVLERRGHQHLLVLSSTTAHLQHSHWRLLALGVPRQCWIVYWPRTRSWWSARNWFESFSRKIKLLSKKWLDAEKNSSLQDNKPIEKFYSPIHFEGALLFYSLPSHSLVPGPFLVTSRFWLHGSVTVSNQQLHECWWRPGMRVYSLLIDLHWS